jgi:DNA replication and repair protein RecF
MQLAQLLVENFRNLISVELTPAPGLNVVYGGNAAGKTSLLEAIHFLARVRSFRTTRPQQLISRGAEALLVRGRLIASSDGSDARLTVRRGHDRTDVRINGQDVRSLSTLARYLPLQVVNSESQRLLLDGPQVRRSFLDWGVFHVEHSYYDRWRRYDRALRQRNRALRAGDERLARSWEPELEAQAAALTEQRAGYIRGIAALARPLLARWLPGEAITFDYRPGWPAGRALAEAFAAGRGRERDAGYTLYGPHRADLVLRADGVDAQHRLSRGQQKLLALALLLSASQAMHEHGDAVLLIDDLPAELDEHRRGEVLEVLVESGAQAFITTTDRAAIPLRSDRARWFHVEHGRYREVV